jgi:hypothetical protein
VALPTISSYLAKQRIKNVDWEVELEVS